MNEVFVKRNQCFGSYVKTFDCFVIRDGSWVTGYRILDARCWMLDTIDPSTTLRVNDRR